MFDMVKKAQEMQKNLKLMQEELKTTQISGQAGGGLVEVTLTGAHEIVAVRIKPEAVDPADVAMLEDLVKVAVNDAVRAANRLAEEKVSKITGGMKIPGLLG